jgi:ubiquinone/menaquinone biosynthesis C-methylase UbiE
MEPLRKPFQGIWNIIRFNWHFYLLAIGFVLLIQLLRGFPIISPYNFVTNIVCWLIIATVIISLFISFYVYDLSNLYRLDWLNELSMTPNGTVVNITAGFDESSILFRNKFPNAELLVYDFYDPIYHTEVSIKRARKAYPPFPNTRRINTSDLPLQNNYADNVFVILSAHEIRNEEERNTFFIELKRILKHTGKIVVIEHLRDAPNFLAYNIGFFHFIAKSSWCRSFKNAGLSAYKELKITPFITVFIIEKNGSKS